MPKAKKPSGIFAPVSRNIANRPFARDARLKAAWRQSQKTGRWLCDLPGDDTVQFRLPADTPKAERRLPTAFDTNVLFYLLSEAKRQDTLTLEFPSFAAVLQTLHYTPEQRNRDKLKDALVLWRFLAIRFRQWLKPRQYSHTDKDGLRFSRYRRGTSKRDASEPERIVRELPAPITRVAIYETGFSVSIAPEWREQAERYYAMLPLPLPRDAAAQNLVVALRTSKFEARQFGADDGDPFFAKASAPRRIRKLCRKIGLDHRNRAAKLRRAMSEAETWFRDHGGDLEAVPLLDKRSIVFVLRKDVRIERKRNKPAEAVSQVPKMHKSAPMTNDDRKAALMDD